MRDLRVGSPVAVTPAELARELGVPAKRIRRWLRERWARSPDEGGARWALTPEQVAEVRRRFRSPGASVAPPNAAAGDKAGPGIQPRERHVVLMHPDDVDDPGALESFIRAVLDDDPGR